MLRFSQVSPELLNGYRRNTQWADAESLVYFQGRITPSAPLSKSQGQSQSETDLYHSQLS